MERLSCASVEPFGRVYFPPRTWTEPRMLLEEVDEYFRDGITLSPGDVVLDVGANIGAFAICASKMCGGNVSLYCFEPAPLLFSALEKNAAENEWLARARPRSFNVALSSIEEDGRTTELHYFSKFPADSTLDIHQKRADVQRFFANHGARFGARIEPVTGRRIAALAERAVAWAPKGPIGVWGVNRFMGLERIECTQQALSPFLAREKIDRVDLLKIDVEGFEPHVLRGIDDATWPRIRQVALETNDDRVPEMIALFRRHGFDRTEVAPSFAAARGVDYAIVTARRSVGAA